MTLEKAIEILEQEKKNHHSFRTDIIGQAEQLGIEALKWFQWERKRRGFTQIGNLTGETED